MTKAEMLDIIKLLSALESWSFSIPTKTIPAYLHEDLGLAIDMLSKEVLK